MPNFIYSLVVLNIYLWLFVYVFIIMAAEAMEYLFIRQVFVMELLCGKWKKKIRKCEIGNPVPFLKKRYVYSYSYSYLLIVFFYQMV